MSAEIQQQESTEKPSAVADVNTAVAEFDRVAAGIGALKQQYAGVVFDVVTTAGMKAACEARAAIRAPRYEVEKVRKAVKAPLLALGKDIDERAKRITADLLAIEEPVHLQITTEEARKEEERKARLETERRRVAAINDDIENDLRCVPARMIGASAATIDTTIRDVVAIEITVDRFAEFTQLASAVKALTLSKLREMHTRQLAHEAEQQRLAEERAELAKQRAAQEQANRLERERIAAEEAAARAKREKEEAEARRKREAEEAAAAAERKRLNDEIEARLKAEREDAERRERERQAQREREDAERRERERREQQEQARLAAAEEQRQAAERERAAKEAALNSDRLRKIQAIDYQVTIAQVGRSGVRIGGTRECIVDTLAETKAWHVGEDHFGQLAGAAHAARARACQQIQALLDLFDEREARRVEQAKLDAERAADRTEQRRIAEENARQAQELQRRQAELDQKRAEAESRLADAERLLARGVMTEAEARASLQDAAPVDFVEISSPGRINGVPETTEPLTWSHSLNLYEDESANAAPAKEFAPTAEQLIELVACNYGVGPDMAAKWCRDAFAPVA